MRRLWRLEEVEGVPWREATSKTERLSEPLKDLLDKLLEKDEAKRPTLEEVGGGPGGRRCAEDGTQGAAGLRPSVEWALTVPSPLARCAPTPG